MRSRGRTTFRKPTNSWEPWHFGYFRGPEPCSAVSQSAGRSPGDGRGSATDGLPDYVPGFIRAAPVNPPRIALFQPERISLAAIESGGWLRYLLERVWELPYASVTSADIAAGGLDGYDAVLIPKKAKKKVKKAKGKSAKKKAKKQLKKAQKQLRKAKKQKKKVC
jgi:hypothetical protein